MRDFIARHKVYVVTSFILLLLSSGISGTLYWLSNYYLPRLTDSNIQARYLERWHNEDSFVAPENGRVSDQRIITFIAVNQRMREPYQLLINKFHDQSWRVVLDLMEMQPEWQACKYRALIDYNMSPREYEWISDCLARYLLFRWKERFEQYGLMWENFPRPENYDAFFAHESEIRRLPAIILPDDNPAVIATGDSAKLRF
jgi:hypothetical protein